MSIRSTLKSITAWFAGLFTKGKTMNLTSLVTALTVGGTAQLTASEAATFASSDTSILTVDDTGLVTAVAAGSATVTATSTTDTTVTATLELTVTAAAVVLAPVVVPAAAQATAAKTEFEKLEELIEKYGLDTIDKVKAAISFIRSVV